jgi:hypothetical protein
MKRLLRRITAGGFLLNLLQLGFSQPPVSQKTEPSLKIEIRVYNRVQVSRKTLLDAENEASRIFRKAGVETTWWNCSLSREDRGNVPACLEPSGPTDFVLTIFLLSEVRKVEGLSLASESLGSASPCRQGQHGCAARLYHFRVERVATQAGISQSLLLGHAIAHELGHLLLGVNAHSTAGLMLAMWRQKQLRQAAKGDLLFTAEEAEVIRRSVLTRAVNQETVQNSGLESANNETVDESNRWE